MYIYDMKLFARMTKKLWLWLKKKKKKKIQPVYRNEILHRKMCHGHNEKWKKTNNGNNRTANWKKRIRMLERMENFTYRKILEADTIKQETIKYLKQAPSNKWREINGGWRHQTNGVEILKVDTIKQVEMKNWNRAPSDKWRWNIGSGYYQTPGDEILEVDTIKQVEMKKRKKKRVHQKN